MDQEIILWLVIVLVLGVVLLLQFFVEVRPKAKHHLLETLTEEELIYCPGDQQLKRNTDDDL